MAFIGKITDTDGVTGLIGSTLYGTCATEAATVAKVGTLADFDTLMTGVTIHIKFTYSNTATDPTLNVNGTGAKRIYKAGTTSVGTTVATSWAAGSVISLTYDGSAWIMNDHTDDTNTNVTQSQTTTTEFRPLVLGAKHNTDPSTLDQTITDQVYTSTKLFVQPSTGNLTLHNSGTGDSPAIIFRRGTMIDNYLEWRIYDTEGRLHFDRDKAGSTETWENILKLDPSNNAMYFKGTAVSLAGHTHPEYVLKAGDTMTGNLKMYSASGDSPSIIFQRGTDSDDLLDWKMTVKSGYLYFDRSASGSATWSNVVCMDTSGIKSTGYFTFTTSQGYYLKDAAGKQYAGIFDNGSNLWIGAQSGSDYQHKGWTDIGTGWSGTLPTTSGETLTGNPSIKICVPTYTSNGSSGTWAVDVYQAIHSGNFTTTGSGNAITSVAFTGDKLTFTKGATFLTSLPSHDHAYLVPVGVAIQTGSTKQSHITLQTLMNWLINTKGYITSGVKRSLTILPTWSYADNDILQLTIGSANYELQLAGVVIEFEGVATNYNTGTFRLRIHSSPTASFTEASGYTKFPVSHIAEYTCNGSAYSPTWKMIIDRDDIVTGSTNGTIKVAGKPVSVYGLGSAAYTESSAYLPSTTTYAGSTTVGGAATNVNITDLNANAEAAVYYPTFVSGNGSQALKTNTTNGPRLKHEPGTTSDVGIGRIMLGNATPSGTAGNAKGQIAFYSESSGYAMLEYATTAANSTFQFPAKASGTYTLAVTSDIPTTYAGSTTAGGIANQAHYLVNERLVSTSMTYGSEKLEWYDLSANNGNDPTKKQNPENDWFHHITMHHKNNAGYYFDMAYSFHTNAIYYRRVQNGADKGWVRLIDSSNIGSQTVSSAATLSTPRNISLGTGVASTATAFDGSADITIPVTGIKEAYLTWGGKDYASSYGPLDAALTPRLGANRMEFLRASGITVERSTDSGSTWADAGLTNVQKVGLFTTPGTVIAVSATSTAGTGSEAAKNMMRVTVATSAAMIYTSLNKFIIFMSTDGASNCYVKIRARLQKNVSAGNDTWIIWNKTSKTWVSTTDASATDANTRCTLSGWTGFNVINVSAIITYGNNVDVQYGNIQFIFGCTGNSSTSAGMKVISIQGYGGVGWTTPSTMALTGHLYSYDASQNATFPAVVIASNGGFRGNLNGTATNANNIATTVTPGSSSELTNYGVIFTDNPSTSEFNVARKNNDFRIQLQDGTASTAGWASLILGNSTASGTAGNKEGRIVLYSTSTSYHKIIGDATTSTYDHSLPNISGTISMLDKNGTNYWGLVAGNSKTDWVRTTQSGIIPYQSGGLSDPHSSIGTSSWAFSAAYIKDIYSTTLREGGVSLTDKYVKQAGDTMTGNLTISTSAFGPLTIQRSGASGAAIFFKNGNGVLGAIGMTETVNSGLYRWTAATTERYLICDSSNTSFSQTVTSGTEIGRITIAGVEKIIYSNSSPVSTGTANKLAYYSNANTISSTPATGYYEIDSTASTPVSRKMLDIRGSGVGNEAAKLISGTVGLLSYGDGGPQINFGTAASMTTANAQEGALIFTDHDSAATGVSWHFVSNQDDWNVTSKRFHAKTSISIGTNLPVTSHALYVNGSGYMNGILTLYSEGTTSQDNGAGIRFINKDTTTGQSSTGAYIYTYSDHLSTSYGSNMVIQPCGSLFVGGGEAAYQHYTTIKSTIGSNEHIYLTADGCIYLQANAGTIANRVGFVNDAGDIIPCKADTKTNNIGSIGTSTYKWNAMYATKFYGPLEGNASTSSRTGIRWNAVSQGQKWSRFFYSIPTNSTVGSSCILTIDCTRGSVVVNASFLITASHAAEKYAKCIQIASNNYTPIKVRLVADGSGDYYFEVYDTAQSIASGTTQTWHCCLITLGNATITTYTSFTDGTTVPTNFTAMNEFTTTIGSNTVAIKNISRNGTTFTATRQDGTTFTFTQQDTTYTHPSYDQHDLGLYKIAVDSLGHVSNVEATGPYIGAKTDNSYWGMTTPTNDDTQWIRTSQLGILPYKARSASATSTAAGDACKLGTQYWYFAQAYIQEIYGTSFYGTAKGAKILRYNNTAGDTTSGVQYTRGGLTVGTADGNAAEGSNASYKLWSYPAGGTAVSGGVANIQNLRLYWNSTYFRDIFASPNYKDLYHRAVVNGTAYAWRKIIDSTNYTDYTVTKTGTGASGTWEINITGSAATLSAKTLTAETLDTTEGSFVFKGDNLLGSINDWVGFQADAGNDRFQIVANNQLMFRQNDSTTMSGNWGDWVGSLTPNNVSATSGLKVTTTTTTIGTGTSAFSYDSGVKIEHDVTISTDTTSTASPAHGGTFTTVDSVTRDSYGHVTKINTKTVTLPNDQNTDTKVNVTLATTTKAYLLGTSTTPTSTAQAVTSLADTGVYLDTTAGGLCATNVKASSTVCANTGNSSTAGGVSLYGTDPTTYGIMFRGTSNSGKHGYVQSDWATYLTMNGDGTTRGWVFRRGSTNVGSISGAGNAVFNGSVTVGGNTTNTSGCRMVYTSSTQTLDFVFA